MASARDIALVGILIFAFGATFLVVHMMTDTVITQFENNSEVNSSTDAITAFQGTRAATNRLDYVVGGLFTALMLGIIITGWFVGGHSIFMIVYFIVIITSIITSAVLSNVWETVSTSAQLISSLTSFPITDHLLTYLPRYSLIVGFIGVIVMFAKPKNIFDQ